MFWFEWTTLTSLQFAVSLIAYDGVLSYMDVNHSALLVELAASEAERAHFTMYNAIFSALGSVSVFVSFAMWDEQDPQRFRVLCAGLAATSTAGFLACGASLK